MFPSNKKNMCVGVSTILHGYGARRGTPVGRQFASGSSLDNRALRLLSPAGFNGSVSPFLSPSEMSSIRKTSAGRQTPEKSTRPSASRGVGPGGAAGKGFRLANELASPAFAGSSPAAGVWAVPGVCVPNQIPPVVANTAIQLKARCLILVQNYTGDLVRMHSTKVRVYTTTSWCSRFNLSRESQCLCEPLLELLPDPLLECPLPPPPEWRGAEKCEDEPRGWEKCCAGAREKLWDDTPGAAKRDSCDGARVD